MTTTQERVHISDDESPDDARGTFQQIIADITKPGIEAAIAEIRDISDRHIDALEKIERANSRQTARLDQLKDQLKAAVGDVSYPDAEEVSLAGLVLRAHEASHHEHDLLDQAIASVQAEARAVRAYSETAHDNTLKALTSQADSSQKEQRDAQTQLATELGALRSDLAAAGTNLAKAVVAVDDKGSTLQGEVMQLSTSLRAQAQHQSDRLNALQGRVNLLIALLAALIVTVPLALVIG